MGAWLLGRAEGRRGDERPFAGWFRITLRRARERRGVGGWLRLALRKWLVLRLGLGWTRRRGRGFWYSLDVCRSAAGASMAGVCTTGYRRRARGAEIGARTVRFVFGIINAAGSAGSASIRAVRAVCIHRSLISPGRSTSMRHGCCTGSAHRARRDGIFWGVGRCLFQSRGWG
jgi:hypothetical protein